MRVNKLGKNIMDLKEDEIKEKLLNGDITISVIGLGKLGQPLAAVFSKYTKVVGVDIDKKVVESINRGECTVIGEPGLDDLVKNGFKSGRLSATTDSVDGIRKSDIIVVTVPVFLDDKNNPDLEIIKSVSKNIAKSLRRGNLVIIESTMPPKATKKIIVPILEESGLKARKDFGVAYAPELISTGQAIEKITKIRKKVIGGIDEKSTDATSAIYSVINKAGVIKTDIETAEANKVFDGIYRDVNIALANELALVCKEWGLDYMKVKKIVNDVNPLVRLHDPGAGVGGHCIPVYPYFVTTSTKTDTSLIELARKINDSMPGYMVDLVRQGLNSAGRTIKDSNILILGLAYRGGVKEARNSPAMPIIKILQNSGADIFLYDPLFSREETEDYGVKYTNDFKDMDCIVLVTDHKEFYDLNWGEIKNKMKTSVIVDGRQVVDSKKVRGLGFIYKGIGCF